MRGHGDGLVPSGTARGADGPLRASGGVCACRAYSYAGLAFGAECYCGNTLPAAAAAAEECSSECKGERGSVCGGLNRLSVYSAQQPRAGARPLRKWARERAGEAARDGCHGRAGPAACLAPFVTGVWSGKERRCLKGTMSICCWSGSWLLPRIAALLSAPEQGHVPGTLPQGCRTRGSCQQGGSSTQCRVTATEAQFQLKNPTPFGIY